LGAKLTGANSHRILWNPIGPDSGKIGLIHTRYFSHNIAVKRQKDIDKFEPLISMTNQGMLGFLRSYSKSYENFINWS